MNNNYVIAFAIIVFVWVWGVANYQDGYEKGTWHTALYIRATNILPSEKWRKRNMLKDINSEEGILKSLTPEEREQADWYKTNGKGFIIK